MLFVLVASLFAWLDEPDRIRRFLDASEVQYQAALVNAESYLRAMASGRLGPVDRKRLSQYRRQFKELKTNQELYVPDLPLPPKIGDIGVLRYDRIRVIEVLGPAEALIDAAAYENVPTLQTGEGDQQFIVPQTRSRHWTLLLRGVDNEKLAGHEAKTVFGPFEATSSEDRAVDGKPARVVVVEPFDLDEARLYWEARRKEHRSLRRAPRTR